MPMSMYGGGTNQTSISSGHQNMRWCSLRRLLTPYQPVPGCLVMRMDQKSPMMKMIVKMKIMIM